MVTLRRTIRFSISPGEDPPEAIGPNGFGGVPSMRGLGRYYELEIACRGEPDPVTGYLINIKAIDQAVRTGAIPVIARACAERPRTDPADLIAEVARSLRAALPTLSGVLWRLTPSYCIELEMPMTDEKTHRVLIRQRFDLAAAHRLHCAGLSADANRAAFGKCNNPNGHGHNYRVEPCVRVAVDSGVPSMSLDQIEQLTHDAIIEPFDHTHLNLDTPEFAQEGGLNPSVEHIARVFFERLAPVIRGASTDAELAHITVWETDRTSCTYPG